MEFSVDNVSQFHFSFGNQEKWQEEISVQVEEEVVPAHQLVVYNDEVNSFEYVILTLIEVCDHSAEQAALAQRAGRCWTAAGGWQKSGAACAGVPAWPGRPGGCAGAAAARPTGPSAACHCAR